MQDNWQMFVETKSSSKSDEVDLWKIKWEDTCIFIHLQFQNPFEKVQFSSAFNIPFSWRKAQTVLTLDLLYDVKCYCSIGKSSLGSRRTLQAVSWPKMPSCGLSGGLGGVELNILLRSCKSSHIEGLRSHTVIHTCIELYPVFLSNEGWWVNLNPIVWQLGTI